MYGSNPVPAALFDAAMVQIGRLGGAGGAVARDVDWGGEGGWRAEQVVDIGGGYGELLAEIMSMNPRIKTGISFDVDAVVERAKGVWGEGGAYAARYGGGVRERM